jgi:predicted nucleic acid-binding protein
MTAAFLDTVGLVARWNRFDQWHAAATAAFTALLRRQIPLVTTSYILLECANEAVRRP